MRTAVAATILALSLAACGAEDAVEQPAANPSVVLPEPAQGRNCGDTMSSAALAIQGDGAPEDIDPAIVACASLDEFAIALADHPDDVPDEADLEAILRERCQESDDPEVTGSAICEEVTGDTGS